MPKLACESKNAGIETNTANGIGRTTDKEKKQKAVDDGEKEAIETAFADAMDVLDQYGCKGDCERRFSVSFQKLRVRWRLPNKINGDTEYEVIVTVQWTLDIECKHPTHGGVKGGRPE
jgi:hypothetical protein